MSLGISGTVSIAFGLHCFLNNKNIRYYNISAIPMLLALIAGVNYLPPKFANLQFLYVNNLLVQTILRTSDYESVKAIRESRTVSTLLFMSFSGLIMWLRTLTTNGCHRYWYAQNFDVKKSLNSSRGDCSEKMNHLLDLMRRQTMSTAKVALLMSSIKIVTKSAKLLRKSFFEFVVSFIQNFDYKLLGFLFVYGNSFQIFNFLLNEFDTKRQFLHSKSLLSGFLAGTAFYLSPRYFLFTYALTTLIELLMVLYVSGLDQKSELTKFLKSLPWLKIFLCVSLPAYSHWRLVRPWVTPKIMDEFMRVFANDRLALGSQNYAKYILRI